MPNEPHDPLDRKLMQYDLLRVTSQRGRIVPEAADHALVTLLYADLPSSTRYQLAQTARLLREVERGLLARVMEILEESVAMNVKVALERLTGADEARPGTIKAGQ